jgi:hypothetical protein
MAMMDGSMDDLDIDSKEEDHFACAGCGQRHLCRDVWARPNQGPLNSTGLLVGSMLIFLLPILTAIVAAVIAGNYTATEDFSFGQAMAAAGGFIAGVVIAWLGMPLVRKQFSRDVPK